jgi:hypothetical protein
VSVLDWWHYGLFHLSVSLLAVGGAVTLVPDLYRYAVTEHSLLSAAQFKHALVLAQAAPGPNVLYVALVGWQVGVNAAGLWCEWLGDRMAGRIGHVDRLVGCAAAQFVPDALHCTVVQPSSGLVGRSGV